jgi:phosphotransferase system  glucose/maltose/N-acetylglucosamine-specific IIC component
MRKKLVTTVVAMLMAGVFSVQAVNTNRGGIMGFIAGCCFGPRAGSDYNDGKEIHWREWALLVPVVSIVFAVWNGIDGANGVTTKDYAEKYGASYY